MRRAVLFLVMVTSLALTTSALAHHVALTKVVVTLARNHTYQVDVLCDANLQIVGAQGGTLTPAERARLKAMTPEQMKTRLAEAERLFAKRITLRFDGQKVTPTLKILPLGEQGRNVRFTGTIPQDAQAFVFFASRAFGVIHLTVHDEFNGADLFQIIQPSARSRPIRLHAMGSMTTTWSIAKEYVQLGFYHILPEGLDHVLFVVGLFLLTDKLRPLLIQISAFSFAHTCSLGLAMYGIVRVPPAVVEPLIALSIAYVAIENVLTAKLKPWRIAVVFGFGLLHGLGFASALTKLGSAHSRLVVGLLSFNLGVEAGQIAVVLIALLLTWPCRGRDWYRRRVAVPASLAIATIGLYWAIERVWAAVT